MPESVSHQAPAKLNLTLAVGSPGAHGLHPICSWMVTVDLCDDLNLVKLSPGSLSRYAITWHRDAKRRSDINWSITKDLAVRAHLAVQEKVNRDLPIQLRLEKRIPVGGGLGGGSSDAAALLRAINELYELELSASDLIELARPLGSDVPFLVHGGSAIVQGLGEEVERHPSMPDLHAVLAFPDFACSTAQVYSLFDELNSEGRHAFRCKAIIELAGDGSMTPPYDSLFNDLAPSALKASPQLELVIDRLSDFAERPAHVSGSGSSLFVICDDSLHAEALANAAQEKLLLPTVAVQTCVLSPGSAILER